MELKLEVWDSPNSAGIVIDAVRCCKLALNHGIAGQLDGPSSYLMKSPHNQRPDDQAREATEKFIAEHARDARPPAPRPRASAEPPRAGVRVARSAPARGSAIRRACRPLAIAQVTPYPWEDEHEVNAYVRRLSEELAARGHRVVVLAPSPRPELVRESRRRIRAGECSRPGERASSAVGELLPIAVAAAARCPRCRSTSRARSRSCSRRRSMSSTSTSRGRPARPQPRCATRAR